MNYLTTGIKRAASVLSSNYLLSIGCSISRWSDDSDVLICEDANGVEVCYFDGLSWRPSKPPIHRYKPRFRVKARAA